MPSLVVGSLLAVEGAYTFWSSPTFAPRQLPALVAPLPSEILSSEPWLEAMVGGSGVVDPAAALGWEGAISCGLSQ